MPNENQNAASVFSDKLVHVKGVKDERICINMEVSNQQGV